jgi:hypothetical protein
LNKSNHFKKKKKHRNGGAFFNQIFFDTKGDWREGKNQKGLGKT